MNRAWWTRTENRLRREAHTLPPRLMYEVLAAANTMERVSVLLKHDYIQSERLRKRAQQRHLKDQMENMKDNV